MKADIIDPKAFPYTTKDGVLLKEINDQLKDETIPLEERVKSLAPKAGGNFGVVECHVIHNFIEYYHKISAMHAKLQEMIADPKWKECEREGASIGYSMKGEDGFLAIKSTGILPCTPIEVQ